MQKILIYVGLIILAIGLLWPLLKELPVGRMPGDFILKKDKFTFYFPFITCLVVSLIISIIFKFFKQNEKTISKRVSGFKMIREIQLKDKEQWEKLYKDYADFYKVEMNNKILQTVWNWLHDKNHEVEGLVYEVDGNIVGLAHYRRMPSPLRGQDIGFLDDLFVDPKHRGQKIGEKLINKMKEISKSKGWNLVRWITHDDNVRAKSLYDRVAKKTNWNVYELK